MDTPKGFTRVNTVSDEGMEVFASLPIPRWPRYSVWMIDSFTDGSMEKPFQWYNVGPGNRGESGAADRIEDIMYVVSYDVPVVNQETVL